MPYIFFTLIFLSLSSSVFALKNLKLATFPIPEYVVNEKEGIFIDIANDIAKKLNISLEILVLPPKRAVSYLKKGKIDGYFPALESLDHGKVLKTTPFYYKKDFIFSLQKVSPLKGGVICLTIGYPYRIENLVGNFTFLKAHSDMSCLKILQKKRANYFLVELHTGIAAMKELNIKNISIMQKPISVSDVFFAFKDKPKFENTAHLFSKEISRMRKSGHLSKYFTKTIKNVSDVVNFGYDPTIMEK